MTMVRTRSGLALCLCLIVVPSDGYIPSKHWERCRSIRNIKIGQTRNCTEHPKIPCLARLFQGFETLQRCIGSDCPTAPSLLEVRMYKAWVMTEHNDEKYNFFGANVSWTLEKTGTQKDYGPKVFEARVEDGSSQRRVVRIEVNLTESDYVNNKAVLYYDCFYPFRHTQRAAVAIIKTIPHPQDHFMRKEFHIQVDADVTSTSATVPRTAAKTTTTTTTTTTTAPPPPPPTPPPPQKVAAASTTVTTASVQTTTKVTPVESTSDYVTPSGYSIPPVKVQPKIENSTITYGVVGVVAALIVITSLVGCFLKRHRKAPDNRGTRMVMVVHNDNEIGHDLFTLTSFYPDNTSAYAFVGPRREAGLTSPP